MAGKNSNSNEAVCSGAIKESESNEAEDEGNVQAAWSGSDTMKQDRFG